MRLGFHLPQMGQAAGPENLLRVAKEAENLGYDTLWVTDRLMHAVAPRSAYPGTADGSLPDPYRYVLDPLEALTYVAAATSRIGLGTSVLDMPYYNPVVLARQFTTLDVLSGGRLRLGLGVAWNMDELEASGGPMKNRGRYANEFIDALKAIWTTDPVEYSGEYFRISRASIQPKPVQKPYPPVYLGAFAPAALKRVAERGDGWFPVLLPLDAMRQMWDSIRQMAREAGRNPEDLGIIVRGMTFVTEDPLAGDRPIFNGTFKQIKSDIEAVREMGALELMFDPVFEPACTTVDVYIERLKQMRELAG